MGGVPLVSPFCRFACRGISYIYHIRGTHHLTEVGVVLRCASRTPEFSIETGYLGANGDQLEIIYIIGRCGPNGLERASKVSDRTGEGYTPSVLPRFDLILG